MPERLVTGCVDNEEAGKLEWSLIKLGDHFALLLYDGNWHVCRTNLLGNTSRLSVLDKIKIPMKKFTMLQPSVAHTYGC